MSKCRVKFIDCRGEYEHSYEMTFNDYNEAERALKGFFDTDYLPHSIASRLDGARPIASYVLNGISAFVTREVD